jgi:hypothetical protein
VQIAISSAVASLAKFEDIIPQNCSFGLYQFCVGFNNSKQDLRCSKSSFQISGLLPPSIQELPAPLQDAIHDCINVLAPLTYGLRGLSTSVQLWLTAGIAFMIPLLILFLAKCYNLPTGYKPVGFMKTALTWLAIGLACCLPYAMLVWVQYKIASEAANLASWVAVERGEIFMLSVCALSCATAFAVIVSMALASKTSNKI